MVHPPLPLQLSELPRIMSTMVSLQRIKLNNNRIVTLPTWIGALTRLKHLSLANNSLQYLPYDIIKCPLKAIAQTPEPHILACSTRRQLHMPLSAFQVSSVCGCIHLHAAQSDILCAAPNISSVPPLATRYGTNTRRTGHSDDVNPRKEVRLASTHRCESRATIVPQISPSCHDAHAMI